MRSASAVAALTLLFSTATAAQAAGPQMTQPAVPSAAQHVRSPADSVLEARTTEVAKDLRCPVCQGLSIQDSPSELSQEMRAIIKQQLASGTTPAEVKGYFVARYGEWILLAPKARGFNLVAYAAPALLFLGGLGFIAFVVRRWTTAGPVVSAPTESDGP